MGSLNKIISLNQASQMSGYTQDYLGYLMRRGEIKGVKKGRVWFTTEEEIKDYMFKKKIRQNKVALWDFFSFSRTKKIIIFTLVFVFLLFLMISNLTKNSNSANEIHSAITSDGEPIRVNN